MIEFNTDGTKLGKVMFSGDLETLASEICFEIAILYGSLYRRDKDAASSFKEMMTLGIINKEVRDRIFSPEIFDTISKGGGVLSVTMNSDDEFKRQLMELLNESK